MTTALVTGAGGQIGGHLVARLVNEGFDVVAVDLKPFSQWLQLWDNKAEVLRLDLRRTPDCRAAVKTIDWVFNLAADMGGIGYISSHHADCMMSVLITANLLQAAKDEGVEKFLGASSACIYPVYRQGALSMNALREIDAYPADAEAGYGEEKLFGERLAQYFYEDYGMQTYMPRFHNVYSEICAYKGGREKAPAAVCRKIATAKISGKHEIEVWGDGLQERSYMYVGDCVEGMLRLMNSDFHSPINLGSSELVSVDKLISIVEKIAGITVKRNYDVSQPQGVRGRNSDNTLIKEVLGWEPNTSLAAGLEPTYNWIESMVRKDMVV